MPREVQILEPTLSLVPEPMSLLTLIAGLIGIGFCRRRPSLA